MKSRSLEFVFGFFVIIIAITFCVYMVFISLNSSFRTYTLNADFSDIGALTEGSKVLVNGYEIGQVSEIKLLYPDYKIHVTMNIRSDIKIPVDSLVSIQSAGLLDAPALAITPGKSVQFFVKNNTITNTKDWVSLEDKIGNILFSVTSN